MKKVISILFLFIIFPGYCFASYKSSQLTGFDYALNKNNENYTSVGGGAIVNLTDDKGNSIVAHCVDPYASACSGETASYEKSKLEDDEYNAIKAVYNTSCGSLTSEECDAARVAAIKSIMVMKNEAIGTESENIKASYEYATKSDNAFLGDASKTAIFKSMYDAGISAYDNSSKISLNELPLKKLASIIYSSNNKKNKKKIKIDKESTIAAIDLNEDAIKIISEKGYKKTFFSQTIDPEEIEEVYNKKVSCEEIYSGFITCTTTADCKTKDEDEVVAEPDTDDSDDETPDSKDPNEECEPQVYTTGTSGECQRMVSCLDSSGNSKIGSNEGHTNEPISNSNMDNEEIDDLGDLPRFTCEGYVEGEKDCNPNPGTLELQPEGTEICDASGTTVVEIYELKDVEKGNIITDDIDNIHDCEFDNDPSLGEYVDLASNGVNTTEMIIGEKGKADNISLNIAGGNGSKYHWSVQKSEKTYLCNSTCTEDYILTLPGPNSQKLSSENDIVRVNAGTFFTIDDSNMKSETTLTCFVKPLHDNLQTVLENARKASVDAHNLYREAEQVVNAIPSVEFEGDEDTKASETVYSEHRWTDEDGVSHCEQNSATTINDLYSSYYVKSISWQPTDCYKVNSNNGAFSTEECAKVSINGTQGKFSNYGTLSSIESDYSCTPGCENKYVSCHNNKPSELKGITNASSVISKKRGEYADITSQNLGTINDEISRIISHDQKENGSIYGVWDYCTKEGQSIDYSKINSDVFGIGNDPESHSTSISFDYEDKEYFGSTSNLMVKFKNIENSTDSTKVESNDSTTGTYYKVCNETKKCDSGKNEEINDYKKGFMYGSEKITVTYEFNNYFCNYFDDTKTPSFIEGPEDTANCPQNEGTIIKGFPVSIETPYGEYSYRYGYIGIGHFMEGNVGSLGRLDSVLDAYGKISETAYDNTCMYGVNGCEKCGVYCKDKGSGEFGNGCEANFGSCKRGCQVACSGGGCLLDSNFGFFTNYKTISLTNFLAVNNNNARLRNPSSYLADAYETVSSNSVARRQSYKNWSSGDKSDKTIEEIVKRGEDAYTDEYLEYYVDLTPSIVQQIQAENKTTPFGKYDGGYSPIVNDKFSYSTYKTNKSYIKREKDITKSYHLEKETAFIGPAWK